jgi:uncharacterized protein involved in exopolysaccharide biosynthesis
MLVDSPNEDPGNYKSMGYFQFLNRWKKPIFIIGALSFIASFIFSGPRFIKPKYKSSVIFFPTTTNSISKALLSEGSTKEDILEFGSEEQAEQLLQILNSDEIRSRIVQKYHLMSHYHIDTTSEFPNTRLYEELENNIKFTRTEYMSVKIEVMDTDAQMAADIANDIGALLDTVKGKIQHVRALEGLKIVETEYKHKAMQISIMEDSLKGLRNKGIFDYKKQSAILSQEYTKASAEYYNESTQLTILQNDKSTSTSALTSTTARMKGAEAKMKNMQAKIDNLANYGGASVALTDLVELERENLSLLKEKYEKAKVDVSENLSNKFIVNNAVKAEKKSYPIRWIVVLISVISSLLLLFFILIFFENITQSNIFKFERND